MSAFRSVQGPSMKGRVFMTLVTCGWWQGLRLMNVFHEIAVKSVNSCLNVKKTVSVGFIEVHNERWELYLQLRGEMC